MMKQKVESIAIKIAPIIVILSCIQAPIAASSGQNSNHHFYLNYHSYTKQAHQWIRTYIQDYDGNLLVYKKELQLIANLIYLSLMRSYATLEAQTEALKALDILWRGWQNVAQTRLDPSKEPPHTLLPHEKQYSLATFWELYEIHQSIGKSYAQAVETIVKSDSLFSIKAKHGVTNMRDQARTVVAQSIVDVKNHIGELFYSNKYFKKGLSFFSYIWEYLPKLAITSFVQANETNNLVSEESWNILMKIQKVGEKTWNMIEQERASFYFAFYKAIWHVIRDVKLDREYLNLSFDQHGFLPMNIETHASFLPEPENLGIS